MAKKKKKKTNKTSNGPNIMDRLRSDLSKRSIGVFLILLSMFLIVSFISFFLTYFNDFSIISKTGFWEIFKGNKEIINWGGILGAYLSYIFIYKTFGIASFGYILILVLFSLRLFGLSIKALNRIIITTIAIMVWLSSAVGYFIYFYAPESLEVYSGIFGIMLNSWLDGFIGKVGAGLLLLFITIVLPMFLFGVRYSFLKNIKLPKIERKPKAKKVAKPKKPKKKKEKTILEMPEVDIEPEIEEEEITKEITKEIILESNLNKPLINLKEEKKEIEEDFLNFEIKSTDIPIQEEDEGFDEDDEEEGNRRGLGTIYDPREDLSTYQLPDTEFLINYEERNKKVEKNELIENKNKIVETLKNYKIEISSISATPGPTVTLYEIVPAPGVRISKIKNLEDDIALSLSALGIRIIAPIPGRGTIGIEVPNQNPQIVSMKSLINSPEFKNSKHDLPVVLGRTISNQPYTLDLAKLPHLLMAGATGQGKSVGLNVIIASLLYKKHPAEIKFVMVDPKKVELSLYNKIERHFLAKLPDTEEAIITDVRKVVATLNSLGIEMDQRYDLLKEAHVRNIKEYNKKFKERRLNPEKGHKFLPYIILVIDEFADLIMTAGKEIEMPIARLAQLARAVGIHLIIATQRPSVNIITGVIKANFPARVAFRVASRVDSRTILDTGGADQLIGRGDMLLSTGNEIIRLQCALIETEEIDRIADFIGSQRAYPQTFLLPEYIDEDSEPSKEIDPRQFDERFEEAARMIVSLQHGSTSILQRKLSLGYNRAGRIIDQLESAGIVGPFEGSRAREVWVKTEAELEEILKELK